MLKQIWLALALTLAGGVLTACGPLVGAGAAVVADQAAENDGGNLF
jgi:hypothetical protein